MTIGHALLHVEPLQSGPPHASEWEMGCPAGLIAVAKLYHTKKEVGGLELERCSKTRL